MYITNHILWVILARVVKDFTVFTYIVYLEKIYTLFPSKYLQFKGHLFATISRLVSLELKMTVMCFNY